MRQQEEKQRSPAERAKEVEELGLRMDHTERSVGRLDKKMDESLSRLESMLQLLLAKGAQTPPAEAPAIVAEEDISDVHAPGEDTALTTTPQTMPSPTKDKTEVAEEGDAVDADNEEESEEVHQGGGSEEVLGGAGQEKGLETLATQAGAGETPAPEKGTEVVVQKVHAAVTGETPKVVDLEKPEQVKGADA
jgi:hypothetical protein